MESFLNRFTEIGFFQSKPETWTGVGWSREYKYYPEYFDDKHYTLVIYIHDPLYRGPDAAYSWRTNTQISPSSEYRLYLHSTKDLKYIKSEFQVSYFESSYDSLHFITSKMKMEDEFNRLFKLEIREKNLKIILE
jgi:hypothetical protein